MPHPHVINSFFPGVPTMTRKAKAYLIRNSCSSLAIYISLLGILLSSVECRQDHHRHMKFPDSFSNLTESGRPETRSENNEGVFVQIPHSNPPTVRPPPYTISHNKCLPQNLRENWIDTLCGDLNTGLVPQNPMGHKFLDGGTYPFETIKNKTLEFFRRALPILKSDKSLPKVAKYAMGGNYLIQPPTEHLYRAKRGIATREAADPSPLLFDASYPDSFYYDDPVPSATSNRQRRQHSPSNPNGFCENRLGYYNRLCKLYNAMWGKTPHNIQRDASGEVRRHHGTSTPHQNHHHHQHHSQNHHQKKHFRQAFHTRPDMPVAVGASDGSGGGGGDWAKTAKHLHTGAASNNNPSAAELPPTPCPSAAEYLTPVFARNHEGAWRYVVQIPKEGYFTQTVEVTKCLKSNCYYMEGSCKTSPRWQSLLVAEMFYPDTTFPTTPKTTTTTKATPLLSDGEAYPDYLYSKGSSASLENGGSSYSNELGLPFKKRSIRSLKDSKNSPPVCDGYDEVGCYQVRLFYDWFLIPGSCKCWKRQFDFTLKG